MNDRIDEYIKDYNNDKVVEIRREDIKKLLNDLNFYYEEWKTFDLIDQLDRDRKLIYDYYIPRLNLLIEYNNERCFGRINYHKKYNNDNDYLQLINEARSKDNFAINHGFHSMIVPYWESKKEFVQRLMDFVNTKEVRLNSNAEHYINALVEDDEVDLNYIKINDLYDDYLDMLKELKVDDVVEYELFKSYLTLTYNLKFIKTSKVNKKWVDIYSQLESDDFNNYTNSAYSFVSSISEIDIMNHTCMDVIKQYRIYCQKNNIDELDIKELNRMIANEYKVDQQLVKFSQVVKGLHDFYLDDNDELVRAWVKVDKSN